MPWDAPFARFAASDPRLCLDLRRRDRFDAGHIEHATHVDGVAALRHRFSTLPPRGVQFLVVCEEEQLGDVAHIFQPPERWDIAMIAAVCESVHVREHAATHACFSVSLDELSASARAASIAWRPSAPQRTSDPDDYPYLLFQPAPVVRRAVQRILRERGDASLRVLDVGCGAGRDLAYVLTEARRHAVPWRATALDRWRAALKRAQLLLEGEGFAPAADAPCCEAVICATVDAEGEFRGIEALAGDASSFADQTYDVVLLVRFYSAPLLQRMPALVLPGGYVIFSHFLHEPARVDVRADADVLTDYASPPVDARLHAGDISRLHAHWNTCAHFDLVENCVEPIEDGRPVQSVIFRRRPCV